MKKKIRDTSQRILRLLKNTRHIPHISSGRSSHARSDKNVLCYLSEYNILYKTGNVMFIDKLNVA